MKDTVINYPVTCDSMIALKVNNISFSYGETMVLHDISLEIKEGEFIGIIGPNGAGKSTFLRTLCGILKPQTGSIELYEKDLRSLDGKARAQYIAFVPQETHYSLNFNVEDIVTMGRYPYLRAFQRTTQQDLDAVQHALDYTATRSLQNRLILSLSSGERQRVVLARALSQEPQVLLLDEPTSHLDILHQYEIMELLKSLNQKNMTVVIVHHDLNLASLYCQRLVVLHEGNIFTQGGPNEIITRETIRTVYKTEVDVINHPRARVPQVILKTKNILHEDHN